MSRIAYRKLEKEVADMLRNQPFFEVVNEPGMVGRLWRIDAEYTAKKITALIKRFAQKGDK